MLRVLIRAFAKKDILKNELLTNPFFQRAFPHISRNNDHKLIDKFIDINKELIREDSDMAEESDMVEETDSAEEVIRKFKTEKYYNGIKVKEAINPKDPENYADIEELLKIPGDEESELAKNQDLSSATDLSDLDDSSQFEGKDPKDSTNRFKSSTSDEDDSNELVEVTTSDLNDDNIKDFKDQELVQMLAAKIKEKQRAKEGKDPEGQNVTEESDDKDDGLPIILGRKKRYARVSDESENYQGLNTNKTESSEDSDNSVYSSSDDNEDNKNDPENRLVAGWGDTLFFRKIKLPITDHEIEELTDKTFVEGYRTIPGPLKWMPEKEKERIHAQIDLKMDELEDTGLSRQEILLNKPGGIPLSQDPVFQYIRKNRLAREMLVKQGEEFTAYKVVDYALRQDFGPDLANVAEITPTYEDQTEPLYMMNVRNQTRYPQLIEPRDYYWKEDTEGKNEKRSKYFDSNELIVRNTVESRGKYMKRNRRYISKKDIHYKNTEFLSQFMTDSGFILNRLQTRLPEKVQRKVAKAIKHARILNLIPIRGFILPVHKLNLVPMLSQNFQDIAIHCETGAVFSRAYKGNLSQLNTEEYPNTIDKIAKRFKLDNHADNLKENMRKVKKFINYDIQFFPNKQQVDILEAHHNLKTSKPVDEKVEENLVSTAKGLNSYDFHEGHIYEKAANLELYKEKESTSTDLTVEQGIDLLKQLKLKFGIKESSTPSFYKKLIEEKPYKNSLN